MAQQQHLLPEKGSDQERNPAPEISILRDSLPTSRLGLYTVLALEAAITIFLVVVVFADVYLKRSGSFSTSQHALYVTGTTVAASAVVSLVAAQIRTHWLARLFRIKEAYTAKKFVGRGRAVLGLGTWHQNVRQYLVAFSMIAIGLITSSVVAGISPSTTLIHLAFDTSIRLNPDTGDLGYYSDFYSSNNASDPGFSWQLPDGSYFTLNTSWSDSSSSMVLPALDTTAIRQAQDIFRKSISLGRGYAYVSRGTTVFENAIGVPNDYEQGFSSALFASDALRSITACFPVLSSNPVRCTKSGNLTATANSIVVEAGDCRVESPILGVDPRSDSASVFGVCTHNRPIGEATLVIGSVYQHTDRLATAMGDSNPPSSSNSSGYVVLCSVDIQPSIAFRLVDYSFLTARFPGPLWLPDNSSTLYPTTGASYPKTGNNMGIASNGKECAPSTRYVPLELKSLMTNNMLATGAAASWPLLSENAHVNG